MEEKIEYVVVAPSLAEKIGERFITMLAGGGILYVLTCLGYLDPIAALTAQ